MSNVKRPGWDRYFMDIAQVAAKRSNCSRRQVAAVLVRDKRIISTGYNGTPRGVPLYPVEMIRLSRTSTAAT
jgi:dCMP deaminase